MRVIQKLLKLLFIVGWVLIIVIGYAEVNFYKKHIYKLPEGYLGEVGGRKISAVYGYFNKDSPLIFGIKVNGNEIYAEIDRNKDGVVDDIGHFENNHEVYSTSYDSSTRALLRRNITYYDEKGQYAFTVIDAKGNGEFFTRIKYIDAEEGKNIEETAKTYEIFVDNKWRELKKENNSHGFYNDAGKFIPIEWNKYKWQILGNKE